MNALRREKLWIYALCLWAIASMWSMAPMSIAAGIFAVVSLWNIVVMPKEQRQNIRTFIVKSAYAKATIFLFFASTLSAICAWLAPPLGIPPQNIFDFRKMHYFLLPVFVLFAWTRIENNEKAQQLFWKSFWSMAIIVSLVSCIQFFGASFFSSSILENRFFRPVPGFPFFHAQGLMYFHLSFASAMGFAYSYAVAKFLWRERGIPLRAIIFRALVVLLTGAAIFFTFSRIAWVAVFAVPVLLAFMRKPKLGWAMLLIAALGVATLWQKNEAFYTRFHEMITTESNGLAGRLIVWRSSLEMIKDRPWTGVGFGKTGQYSENYSKRYFGSEQWFSSHSHNNFLDAFASTGILGAIAYLVWWFVLFLSCLKSFREAKEADKWFPAAGIAAIVAFQINGLTQVNFYDGKSQHALMLWVGLVLVMEWRRQNRLTRDKFYP